MRVTQFTLYNNNIYYQQNSLSQLNKTQTKLATGLKINTLDDNPTLFTKFLKLSEEENSLTQVKLSATFAQTFANNTDTALNDFVSTLSSFKVKLLNAANATNDETSIEAIKSELEGMLNHLKDLANTSIDGKYLFSGSKFDTKPIDDNFKYQGNSKRVKAFLGSNVERAYNIDGKSLFLGRDNDYSKHISTNVTMFNKMKQHPEFVVRGSDGKLYIDKHNPNPDSSAAAENVIVDNDSQIRMLTGVEDIKNPNGSYSDGVSYFYLKGRKPNGETFNAKFSLLNSQTVQDLLDKIGAYYGNTPTSKIVDVSLNSQGQIQIKDIQTGKLSTDFYLVASDKNETNIKDLVKNGDYIVSFNESNFNSLRNVDTITANNGYFDNRIFKFGSNFKLMDNSRDALNTDLLTDVIGSEAISSVDGSIQTIDHLTLRGTDVNGNSVNYTFNVSGATMQDLINSIETNFKVDVSLENGELVITDPTISKTQTSNFSLSISAQDSNGNNLNAFRSKDVANFDELFLDKSGNILTSNVSQIIKDNKTYIKDGKSFTIHNENAQTFATDDTSLVEVLGDESDLNNLGEQIINIKFKDKNGNLQQAQVVLRDTLDANAHKSYFWIDTDKDGQKDSSEIYDIYTSNGKLAPAHNTITTSQEVDPVTCEVCTRENLDRGVTYSQLSDVIAMITSGNLPASNSFDDYKKAISTAKEEIDAGLDNYGKFFIKDKINSDTKLDISIYTDNNSLTFQANNAITIDSAKVDFFKTLQDAIEAASNKNNYPDNTSSNPRNIGIQGAIEAIDHLNDHIRRAHATIGAISNEFNMTIERTDMLIVNVQSLQSDNIDVDFAEASMQLSSLTTSYQALLSSIAKVNNLTLLNYLR